MKDIPPLGLTGLIACIVVVALAGGTRFGYLMTCCDGDTVPHFAVQGDGPRPDLPTGTQLRGQETPNEFDELVQNLSKDHWFGSLAPLADLEERTAHVSPGYPWLASWAADDDILRGAQGALGVLTALCLFFYARLAFRSNLAGIFAGLLAALQPFWIVNAGELADGSLTTFLLAAALLLGTLAGRTGGPLTSLVFGLSLAGLALVRATTLPFAFLALGWFLLRFRSLRLGWFAGLLALLGFGNGLAPWLVRNCQTFQRPIPVVDSAWLHVWIGVMPGATGGEVDEKVLRESLPPERVKALVADANQAMRYDRLSHDVMRRLQEAPGTSISGRIVAASRFLFGEVGQKGGRFVSARVNLEESPALTESAIEAAAAAGLILLLGLAFFGWRWSDSTSEDCRLATLALVWLPLPYLLSHAERLSGPRLPWDVVLVAFAGFALARCVRGQAGDEAAQQRRVLELQQQTTLR